MHSVHSEVTHLFGWLCPWHITHLTKILFSIPFLPLGAETAADSLGSAPDLCHWHVQHYRRVRYSNLEWDSPQDRIWLQPYWPWLPWSQLPRQCACWVGCSGHHRGECGSGKGLRVWEERGRALPWGWSYKYSSIPWIKLPPSSTVPALPSPPPATATTCLLTGPVSVHPAVCLEACSDQKSLVCSRGPQWHLVNRSKQTWRLFPAHLGQEPECPNEAWGYINLWTQSCCYVCSSDTCPHSSVGCNDVFMWGD